MTLSRKLSSDEVNALIDGLTEEERPEVSAGADVSDSKVIRSFTLGSDDQSVLGDYYALRMINERFARKARGVFLPMLRLQPRISSFPPEIKSFDDYCSELDPFMSLTLMRMEELRGSLMMVMDPSFISIMTNSYFGGAVSPLSNRKPEFTDTESRVIELVTQGLGGTLEGAWKDLMTITLNEIGREVNPQFASFVDGADLVIVCSFVVMLPDMDPATFDVIYPLQTLRPIASQLRSRTQSDTVDDDISWRHRLERAVMDIPLSVEVKLASPTVPMTKLIFLKPGDVVQAQLFDNVQFNLEGQPFFVGEMGDVAGQAAVNLTARRFFEDA